MRLAFMPRRQTGMASHKTRGQCRRRHRWSCSFSSLEDTGRSCRVQDKTSVENACEITSASLHHGQVGCNDGAEGGAPPEKKMSSTGVVNAIRRWGCGRASVDPGTPEKFVINDTMNQLLKNLLIERFPLCWLEIWDTLLLLLVRDLILEIWSYDSWNLKSLPVRRHGMWSRNCTSSFCRSGYGLIIKWGTYVVCLRGGTGKKKSKLIDWCDLIDAIDLIECDWLIFWFVPTGNHNLK